MLVPPVGSVFSKCKLAGFGIDCECADIRRVIEIGTERERILSRDIKKSLVRMDREERGIDNLRGQFRLAQLACRRLEAADINSLAMASAGGKTLLHVSEAGVSAEINEILTAAGALQANGTKQTTKQASNTR